MDQYIANFVPLIGVLIIFYLFVLKPQQEKAKKHLHFLSNLKVGTKVLLNSGIVGTITSIEEKTIKLRTADHSIEVTKDSILNEYK